MSAGFVRQTSGGSFVAYTKAPSKRTVPIKVNDSEDQAYVHPEVFVQEYTSIKVKALNDADNGRGGLYVEFDPRSVDIGDGKTLTRNINGSIQSGGELERALRWALENDAALYVGIELRRKYQRPDKSVIPYDSTIMELRGFTPDGESTDAAQGLSRQNISRIVAVVGRVDNPAVTAISPEVQSNPLDWEQFRANRVGATPPPGWVRITRPDGTPGGAGIARDTFRELAGAGAAGPALDAAAINQIAELVAEKITPPVTEHSVVRPRLREGRSAEGKRWELFNSDGRINPGSYVLSAAVSARGTALTILEGVNYFESEDAAALGREPNLLNTDEMSAAATKLMVALLKAADEVQKATSGRVSRMDASHRVAGQWVSQVATRELPLRRGQLDDVEAKKAWMRSVIAAAEVIAVFAVTDAESHADGVADPAPIGDNSGRAQREASRQNNPEPPQSGPQSNVTQMPANRNVDTVPEPDFGEMPSGVGVEDPEAIVGEILNASNLRPQDVAPLLSEIFGAPNPKSIDPLLLRLRVDEWKTDVPRFKQAARAAYETAANQVAS